VAQILGIVCIFFAVDLEKARLPRPYHRVFEDGNECRRCCTGNAAQILGIVCIFFAVDLEKAQLPRPETDWLLIGFVAFHFLTHLLLSLINCVAEYKHAKT
jgi:hypothetical protein